MPFLAGETITAGKLNRLQPKTFYASASGTVAASQTNVDIPGCSITLTTETNNAQVDIWWSTAFYSGATAPTTFGASRALIDGSGAPVYAISDSRTINAKDVPSQDWTTTIAAAGSHTIKLQVTTPANMTVSTYTALRVVVTEVV